MKRKIVEAITIGPMNEMEQRLALALDPIDRGFECLEEFRQMLDEGFVLTGPDITRVIKLIAKTDSILIPLRGSKYDVSGME